MYIDSFLKFIGISSGVGAVTGYLQFHSGGPWAWIVLAALAGSAFTMMLMYYFFLARHLLSVFGRISIASIGIIQAGIENIDDAQPIIRAMTLQVNLHNHSDQIVHFRIQRATLTMSGLIRPNVILPQTVEIAQAHSDQGFILPTLPDIPIPTDQIAPKGSIELEILYGASKDNLPYLFSYTGEPQIGINIDKDKREGKLIVSTAVRALSHKKQSWFT